MVEQCNTVLYVGLYNDFTSDDILSPNFREVEHALNVYPDVKHLFVPVAMCVKMERVFYTPDYCDGSMIRYTASEYKCLSAYEILIFIDVQV